MTTGCARRQLSGLGVITCGCFAGLALVAGCNSAPPPVDTAAAVQAVKDADAAALKAAQALDANGTVSYYSDDAMVMPPNAPAITDRASAQKAWAAMLVPGAKVSWATNRVESAASGDIVYEQGTYSVTMPGPDGKWVNDTGKYLGVWKKQADGSWKEVEDMWNSDLPAVAAAPVKKKGK
jgi:ketosteroid isomerase-like protein